MGAIFMALVPGSQETLVSKSFSQEYSFEGSKWREALSPRQLLTLRGSEILVELRICWWWIKFQQQQPVLQKHFSISFEFKSAVMKFFQQSFGLSETVTSSRCKVWLQMCVFFHLWRTLANTFVILRDVYMQKTCNKTYTFSDQTSKLEKKKKVQLFGVLGDFLTIILIPNCSLLSTWG